MNVKTAPTQRPPAFILLVVLVSALLWRLPLIKGEKNLLYCNNDAIYHLKMVKDSLQNYPRVETRDSYSHYPGGYRVHWLPFHTFFYASAAKLLGCSGKTSYGLLKSRLSIIPPLLGVLAALLVLLIAAHFSTNRWFLLTCGLLAAWGGLHYNPFYYGLLDHHLFTHLGILAAILGHLRRGHRLWAAGIFITLATAPAAVFYVTLLLFIRFLSHLAGGPPSEDPGKEKWHQSPPAWYLSPALMAAVALLLNRFIETSPLPFFHTDATYFSLFHPLWLLGTGALFWGLPVLVFAVRQGRFKSSKLWPGAGLTAGLGLTVSVFLLLGHGKQILERLSGSERLVVMEEKSLLEHGLFYASPWVLVLCLTGVFLLYQCWRLLFEPRESLSPPREYFPWLLFLAALVLGLMERRHMFIFSGLLAAAVGLMLLHALRYLRKSRFFAEGAPLFRAVPAVALGLLLSFAFFQDNIVPRFDFFSTQCRDLRTKQAVAAWLKEHTPPPGTGAEGRPNYGVFCPWDFGHHVNILGERPVVVDPFNFPVPIEKPLRDIWLARTPGELHQRLLKYNVRYLVITDPGMQVLNILAPERIREEKLLSPPRDGVMYYTEKLNTYAAVRLFLQQGGQEFAGFKPVFLADTRSTFPILAPGGGFNEYNPPVLQIYEMNQDFQD